MKFIYLVYALIPSYKINPSYDPFNVFSQAYIKEGEEWRLIARIRPDDTTALMAIQAKYKQVKLKKVPDTGVGADRVKEDFTGGTNAY